MRFYSSEEQQGFKKIMVETSEDSIKFQEAAIAKGYTDPFEKPWVINEWYRCFHVYDYYITTIYHDRFERSWYKEITLEEFIANHKKAS